MLTQDIFLFVLSKKLQMLASVGAQENYFSNGSIRINTSQLIRKNKFNYASNQPLL